MQTITIKEWMAEKGYTNRTLAERMNLSYDYIYQLTTDTRHLRPMNDRFHMRFLLTFGLKETERIFGALPEPEIA